MNTKLKELLDALNPGRTMKSRWMYIGVEHDNFIQIHEVHFDEHGDFVGITLNPVSIASDIEDSKKGLLDWLEKTKKDIKENPILTWEQHQLIFKSK